MFALSRPSVSSGAAEKSVSCIIGLCSKPMPREREGGGREGEREKEERCIKYAVDACTVRKKYERFRSAGLLSDNFPTQVSLSLTLLS